MSLAKLFADALFSAKQKSTPSRSVIFTNELICCLCTSKTHLMQKFVGRRTVSVEVVKPAKFSCHLQKLK